MRALPPEVHGYDFFRSHDVIHKYGYCNGHRQLSRSHMEHLWTVKETAMYGFDLEWEKYDI